MTAFYNENDKYPAQWLRNASAANLIAPGAVDERSIKDLAPEDVRGTQAHFFAGIGVWSYALRLAGVPDDFEVWTGSCPCQPFSQAGRGRGVADERHLWPEWFRLIKARRPQLILGEQAASPATVGGVQGKKQDLQRVSDRAAVLSVFAELQRQSAEDVRHLSAGGASAETAGPDTDRSAAKGVAGQSSRGSARQRGEASSEGEGLGVQSGLSGDRSQSVEGALRADSDSVRSDGAVGVERAFAGSNRPVERVHEGEHPSGPVRSECNGEQMGRESDCGSSESDLRSAEEAEQRLVEALGREASDADAQCWIDLVRTDLEREGYAVRVSVFPAACVGAPHIRHRLYFVAHTEEFRWPARGNDRASDGLDEAWQQFERYGDARLVADAYRFTYERTDVRRSGEGDGAAAFDRGGAEPGLASARSDDELADADGQRLEGERLLVRERGPRQDLPEAPRSGEAHELVDAAGVGRGQDRLPAADGDEADRERAADQRSDAGAADGLGDAGSTRGGRDTGAVPGAEGEGPTPWFATGRVAHLPVVAGAARLVVDAERAGLQEQLRQRGVLQTPSGDDAGQAVGRAGSPTGGLWTDAVWLYCRDGKYRSAEPRVVALADGAAVCLDFVRPLKAGVEGRVGKIKAYGNAINALQAAVFIRSFIEVAQHL